MKKSGFTLFELLVVISIIAIIIAVGTASYSSAQKRARDARRKQDIDQVHKALEQYYAVNSAYLVGCNPGSQFLLGSLPSDPKGGTYSYSWLCDLDSYCVCAQLEVTGSGNTGSVGTANACSYSAGDYYCLQNVQ